MQPMMIYLTNKLFAEEERSKWTELGSQERKTVMIIISIFRISNIFHYSFNSCTLLI